MDRRTFLAAGAALAGLMGSGPAAAAAGRGRKVVFVFNPGGWDPTRVLAPVFGTKAAMEPDAVAAEIGGIRFVDHPERPSVRAFFEAWHERSLVLNGVLVPSVAHEACTRILMTGSPDDGRPDWAAVVASEHAAEHLLPGLVVGGPSYAGPLGSAVVRTGSYGQLAELLDGGAILPASADAIDRVLARRAAARQAASRAAREQAATAAFFGSLAQLAPLRALGGELDFSAGASLGSQIGLAVDALATGTSRAVTVATDAYWDSHVANDLVQSPAWEDLFDGLGELVGRLATTASPDGGVLLDDTLVVVVSEMGRTPMLNADLGKDHWPYTSALLVGAGIAGDRVIGGFDDGFEGREVDGADLSPSVFGATVLAAADVDPAEWLPGTPPIAEALA